MHCSTNTKKETILKHFKEAITDYGSPSSIRTNKGWENTLTWKLITEIKDNGRRSFLASSSVHNRRIKQLCRDLWNSVCCTSYYMFPAVEVQGKEKLKNPNMERVKLIKIMWQRQVKQSCIVLWVSDITCNYYKFLRTSYFKLCLLIIRYMISIKKTLYLHESYFSLNLDSHLSKNLFIFTYMKSHWKWWRSFLFLIKNSLCSLDIYCHFGFLQQPPDKTFWLCRKMVW